MALLAETSRAGFKRPLAIARDRIGLVLAGLGALLAAAAFPLDDYWHSLYGIDVTLWAPFHVMIGTAMGLAGVGATAQFAAIRTRRRIARDLGLMIAIAVTSSTFMVFLAESAGRRALLQIGDATLVLYPVLLSVAMPAAVMCAVVTLSRPGAAIPAILVIQVIRQAPTS